MRSICRSVVALGRPLLVLAILPLSECETTGVVPAFVGARRASVGAIRELRRGSVSWLDDAGLRLLSVPRGRPGF